VSNHSNGLRHMSRIPTARLSTMTRLHAVHYGSLNAQQRCADASACGCRSAVIVGSADWQQTYFFIQRWRCCDHNEYSVKILHAVWSAITAQLLSFLLKFQGGLLLHWALGPHILFILID